MTALRRAAFLDRDGTIIDDVHYISRPEDVTLIPAAARAIGRLNAERIPVVVVTNQSGIGRGMFTVDDFHRVQSRMIELLASVGAHVDASYFCPHHPDAGGPCDCRKPGTELFARASRELALDPSRSLFAGDRWRDVAPAIAFGGCGVLVPAPHTAPGDVIMAQEEAAVASTLERAVALFLGEETA